MKPGRCRHAHVLAEAADRDGCQASWRSGTDTYAFYSGTHQPINAKTDQPNGLPRDPLNPQLLGSNGRDRPITHSRSYIARAACPVSVSAEG